MRDLDASLARMEGAWIAGRSALEHCPPEWREAVEGRDGELALLALAAHATEVLTRQAPKTPLALRPLLPALPARIMPETLRPRFRRLLASPKNAPSIERELIDFITARGYAAHPADWIPDPKDDWAPDLYAPWLDWVRAESSARGGAEITIENYDEWSWTERRAALWKLRAEDPDLARAIIAAKAGGEPADRRVRLIELLDNGLSESDAEYLESLAKDRSDRVQALSRTFLARLGRAVDSDELAVELADMVELGRAGLIDRRMRLNIKALKTHAQHARRLALFRLVSLAGLARALKATELQLVEVAPDGAHEGVEAFASMVAATGSDAARRALMNGVLSDASTPVRCAHPLGARLTSAERREILARALKRDADMFETTLALAGPVLGETPFAVLVASPCYAELKTMVETVAREKTNANVHTARVLDLALQRIGLLVESASARRLIEELSTWGLSPAEPRLDMLHFNASLNTEIAS